MNNKQEHIETLQEIRSIMERSSRFISLSGLSGIIAGVAALAGAAAVYVKAGNNYNYLASHMFLNDRDTTLNDIMWYMISVALIVLIVSVGFGVLLTTQKARKKGQKIWDPTAQRLLINLLVPLGTGGLFCLILLKYHLVGFIPPATLVFYGLALFNASKYTLNDIRYLGICEIVLGLLAFMEIGAGLIFWALGFGVLHIIYGAVMYYKYERNEE